MNTSNGILPLPLFNYDLDNEIDFGIDMDMNSSDHSFCNYLIGDSFPPPNQFVSIPMLPIHDSEGSSSSCQTPKVAPRLGPLKMNRILRRGELAQQNEHCETSRKPDVCSSQSYTGLYSPGNVFKTSLFDSPITPQNAIDKGPMIPTAKALTSYFSFTTDSLDESTHQHPAHHPALNSYDEKIQRDLPDLYESTSKGCFSHSQRTRAPTCATVSVTSDLSEFALSPYHDNPDPVSFNTPQHRRNSVTFPLNHGFATGHYFHSDPDLTRSGRRDDNLVPDSIASFEDEKQVLICSFLHHTDRSTVSDFTNAVVDEMEVTSFGHHDSRKGTRGRLPNGFPGMACRHCQGLNGRTGRYFPSSIKTISDSKKSLYAMHKHLATCVECPDEIKHRLDGLFSTHVAARKKNSRHGTQRAFFRKIWAKLHPNGVAMN